MRKFVLSQSGGMITQIGSLPYKDVRRAVSYSLKHDIPFLPELPKRGDAMLDYIKRPGQLSCLSAFKEQDFDVVKIQCIGPATLILAGYEADEAITRILEHISAITNGLRAKKTMLFLDEPALGNAGFDFEEYWEAIFRTFTVMSGVHVCSNMDWDRLFSSKIIEIISFDASKFDITKYPGYRGDKRIAWGVRRKEDIKDFRSGDLLTLPCGMGTNLYKVRDCQRELRKLIGIARSV